MPPTFLLEAFGQLSPGSKLSGIDSGEERDGLFHRVFEARAELMSWSTGWARNRRPLLWNMYDAGLTDEPVHLLDGPTADLQVLGQFPLAHSLRPLCPDVLPLPLVQVRPAAQGTAPRPAPSPAPRPSAP